MAKAKKLPSGNWRTQVYDYTDSDGKKHYKSFTAVTKKESEYLASSYLLNKNIDIPNSTLLNALNNYIDTKKDVLSPNTIKAYISMVKNNFQEIGKEKLNSLNSAKIQAWIGTLKHLSPKSVKNNYGLLSATLEYYAPDIRLKVKLPQAKPSNTYIPSEEEMIKILQYFENKNDNDMVNAISISAFGTLRRGELCALTAEDVTEEGIIVNKARVYDLDNNWVDKTPKNYTSNRFVPLPKEILDRLPKEGKIINTHPDILRRKLAKVQQQLGIQHFRFHDLRHFAVSNMIANNIPMLYIQKVGGWSTDSTVKKVYAHIMNEYDKKYSEQTVANFSRISHEISHDDK